MASNKFNASNATKKPPAHCWYRKDPLPIFFPPGGPARIHGYARFTNLNPTHPDGPIDIAVYMPLLRTDSVWSWHGSLTKGQVRIDIDLSRQLVPQPWQVVIYVWDPWRHPALQDWPGLTMQLDPSWDTGLLQHVHTPGIDFREARVRQ